MDKGFDHFYPIIRFTFYFMDTFDAVPNVILSDHDRQDSNSSDLRRTRYERKPGFVAEGDRNPGI